MYRKGLNACTECGLRKKSDKNSFFDFIFIVLQCFSRRYLIREVRVVWETYYIRKDVYLTFCLWLLLKLRKLQNTIRNILRYNLL